MKKELMLTTVDNPYNPFTQADEWLAYDTINGYHTSELLARVAHAGTNLSDKDESRYIDEAVLDIVRLNPLLYAAVTEDTKTPIKSRNELLIENDSLQKDGGGGL